MKIITIFLVLVLCDTLKGQLDNVLDISKTGTAVAQFLKIGVDPRASAMGNAYAAAGGSINSMYWNPAGLGKLQGFEAIFVQSQWLSGIDFTYSAIAVNFRRYGIIGASIINLRVPEDIVRTVEEPEGTGEFFDANDLAVSLVYAKQLTDKFSIGGAVKYINQRIWHSDASAIAVDFGSLFVTPFNDIRIGASLSNYGSDMQMNGRDLRFSTDPDPFNEGNVEFVNSLYETDAFPLPLLFRVGVGGEIINTKNLRLTFGLDALHPNDNVESVNTGAELAVNETLYLRAGYSSLYQTGSETGFTFGGGFHYRIWRSSSILKIDYSYTDFGLLKNTQKISIGIKL